eukprot:1101606-Rhodomonas_salina.1
MFGYRVSLAYSLDTAQVCTAASPGRVLCRYPGVDSIGSLGRDACAWNVPWRDVTSASWHAQVQTISGEQELRTAIDGVQ